MKYAVLVIIFCLASSLTLLPAQDHRGPDGRYHDPNTGEVQPEMCDNLAGNPHPCECYHAKPMCDGTDAREIVGSKCKTYCRLSACRCDTCCEEKKK
jgi:hypothetical protein